MTLDQARQRADRNFKKEERARDGRAAMAEYEVQARAIREKTARLKALRLAKEAQEQTEKAAERLAKPTEGRPTRRKNSSLFELPGSPLGYARTSAPPRAGLFRFGAILFSTNMRNILIVSSAVVFIGAVGVLAFTRHWGLPSTPKETTFAIGQANTTSVSTSSASNPTASSTSVQPFQAPISIPSTSTPIAPNFQVVDMMSAISSTSTPIAPNFEGVDMSTVGSTTPCDTDPKHNLCLKSSTAVYSEGYLILGADPNTFTVLGYAGYYGKDDKHVYWLIEGEEGPEPHQVLGADAASFTVLSNYEWYAKDNSHVYWAGYLIPGADPKTFRVVDPPEQCGPRCQIEAQDRSHTYEITY